VIWGVVAAVLGVAALGLFLYWALVITEGVYLGPWAVRLMYDLTPGYYDRIKAITWKRDRECLTQPLLQWLDRVRQPLVLDVGAGTGRFPAAMLADESFDGQVWGLDASLGMLLQAWERLEPLGPRCTLIWGDADDLPFPDEVFDAVVCLETLEFTPNLERTVSELMRVLRPGGVLLVTNRIGRARWFPGRAYDDDEFIDLLCAYPLSKIEIHSWNTFYDQVWIRKAGDTSLEGRGGDSWKDWLLNADECETQGGIVRWMEDLA